MTIFSNLKLFPLQSITNFSLDSSAPDPKSLMIFGIVIVVFIIVIVIINIVKKGSPAAKKGYTKSGGVGGGGVSLVSHFKLSRIAGNIGLDHDQKKMLFFVFRTDAVTDPERSVNNPSLLDRHFRRAYRIIEQTSRNQEEVQERFSVLFSTRNMLENNAGAALTSTRQLQDDMHAILIYGKERYTVPVLSTKGENLAVECPQNALGTHIKIPRGNTINVMAFTKSNKGFSFDTRIAGTSVTRGIPTILLAHSNRLKVLSQRRFRRRQTVIACYCNFVYVEGSGKKQRLIVDKRRLTGNIMDISIGGCSIRASAAIRGGDRLKIECTIGNSSIAALGQVLRTNRVGGNTIMHIRFLKVSRKTMNTVNAYVYEYASE